MVTVLAIGFLVLVLWVAAALSLGRHFPGWRGRIRFYAILLPVLLVVAYGCLFTQVSYSTDLVVKKGADRLAVQSQLDALTSQENLERLLVAAKAERILSQGDLRKAISVKVNVFNPGEGIVSVLVTPPVMLRGKAAVWRRVFTQVERDAASRLDARVM